jgi:hypothetical protein
MGVRAGVAGVGLGIGVVAAAMLQETTLLCGDLTKPVALVNSAIPI